MALEYGEDKPKDKPDKDIGGYIPIQPRKGYVFDEIGYWDKTALQMMLDQEKQFKQIEWKGINSRIDPWLPIEKLSPAKPSSPVIILKHGTIEESISLSEADLKPQNRFKLHQKIDALIKKAYNNK